ncbi:hypothetical protein [Enterobacter hormaechei]|uniref:hypothetical protein n=1 Tax=Enterobacter hormaechei TaxID=158836 RepID=UPI00066516B5|nr:hypothetical protein [Enterobacter hormaechei]VAG12107.1 Uncharacterised protein [Enterobacter hormaechei]HCM9300253.1 hypothetical protein [Enterobacter hormaechei subsp. xiangfangensis]
MEKKLPTELEVMALGSLISYVISVLSDEQKQRLAQMAKSRPIEVPSEGATPELMDYMTGMQDYIRDTIKMGLGHK